MRSSEEQRLAGGRPSPAELAEGAGLHTYGAGGTQEHPVKSLLHGHQGDEVPTTEMERKGIHDDYVAPDEEEEEHPSKAGGMVGKLKAKANKIKDKATAMLDKLTHKKDPGDSDASSGSPLSADDRAGAAGRQTGPGVDDYSIKTGTQTPLVGVVSEGSVATPVVPLGNAPIDFPPADVDAVTGKDEKTAVDRATAGTPRIYGVSAVEPQSSSNPAFTSGPSVGGLALGTTLSKDAQPATVDSATGEFDRAQLQQGGSDVRQDAANTNSATAQGAPPGTIVDTGFGSFTQPEGGANRGNAPVAAGVLASGEYGSSGASQATGAYKPGAYGSTTEASLLGSTYAPGSYGATSATYEPASYGSTTGAEFGAGGYGTSLGAPPMAGTYASDSYVSAGGAPPMAGTYASDSYGSAGGALAPGGYGSATSAESMPGGYGTTTGASPVATTYVYNVTTVSRLAPGSYGSAAGAESVPGGYDTTSGAAYTPGDYDSVTGADLTGGAFAPGGGIGATAKQGDSDDFQKAYVLTGGSFGSGNRLTSEGSERFATAAGGLGGGSLFAQDSMETTPLVAESSNSASLDKSAEPVDARVVDMPPRDVAGSAVMDSGFGSEKLGQDEFQTTGHNTDAYDSSAAAAGGAFPNASAFGLPAAAYDSPVPITPQNSYLAPSDKEMAATVARGLGMSTVRPGQMEMPDQRSYTDRLDERLFAPPGLDTAIPLQVEGQAGGPGMATQTVDTSYEGLGVGRKDEVPTADALVDQESASDLTALDAGKCFATDRTLPETLDAKLQQGAKEPLDDTVDVGNIVDAPPDSEALAKGEDSQVSAVDYQEEISTGAGTEQTQPRSSILGSVARAAGTGFGIVGGAVTAAASKISQATQRSPKVASTTPDEETVQQSELGAAGVTAGDVTTSTLMQPDVTRSYDTVGVETGGYSSASLGTMRDAEEGVISKSLTEEESGLGGNNLSRPAVSVDTLGTQPIASHFYSDDLERKLEKVPQEPLRDQVDVDTVIVEAPKMGYSAVPEQEVDLRTEKLQVVTVPEESVEDLALESGEQPGATSAIGQQRGEGPSLLGALAKTAGGGLGLAVGAVTGVVESLSYVYKAKDDAESAAVPEAVSADDSAIEASLQGSSEALPLSVETHLTPTSVPASQSAASTDYQYGRRAAGALSGLDSTIDNSQQGVSRPGRKLLKEYELSGDERTVDELRGHSNV